MFTPDRQCQEAKCRLLWRGRAQRRFKAFEVEDGKNLQMHTWALSSLRLSMHLSAGTERNWVSSYQNEGAFRETDSSLGKPLGDLIQMRL